MEIDVTVIIPVYNNAEMLALCLEAIRAQTFPAERFEVIVVDNASTDNCRSVVDAHGFIYLLETKPGSYAARNAGIRLAKGEILAFTDSDCRPASGWLELGTERLKASVANTGWLSGPVNRVASIPCGFNRTIQDSHI